jgi:hypothetical protein
VETRASSSRSKHEGESSNALCDRLSRTRDFSQRQLPTDQDYAVSTREYQTDQSSLKSAPAAAGPALEKDERNNKSNHIGAQELTGSLHIRAFSGQVLTKRWVPSLNRFLIQGWESTNLNLNRKQSSRKYSSHAANTARSARVSAPVVIEVAALEIDRKFHAGARAHSAPGNPP